MKHVILKSLLLPLAITVALIAPIAPTADQATIACGAKTEARDERVANLERTSSRVERNIQYKDGRLVDKYHFSLTALTGPNANGKITYELVHFGESHGTGNAASEPWHNPANGRDYWVEGEASILHWISDPCSGQDEYAYDFAGLCWREYGGNIVDNYCDWNVYAGLQTSTNGAIWGAPWGYRHYSEQNDVGCTDSGGQHSLTDGFGLIRAWLRVSVEFKYDNQSSTGKTTDPEKMTSKYMATGGGVHSYTTGQCSFVFCDSPTTPPSQGFYPC